MLTERQYLVLIRERRRSSDDSISTENPMSYAEMILPEFDQEMANTRKVLERIPDDKLDWQPHPKSHTIGWNANHIADIPNWLAMVLNTSPPRGRPSPRPGMSPAPGRSCGPDRPSSPCRAPPWSARWS
jgi:hypothetical protein